MTAQTDPLVSVVIPAYNCSRYLPQSVQSVLDQDYPNLEILVVNDGSSDDTLAVARRLADAADGRMHVFDQANAGAAVARNTALRRAGGRYIAFLDSDDLWLPGKLRLQVDYLRQHPDIALVYSAWSEWHPNASGEFTVPVASAPDDSTPNDGIPDDAVRDRDFPIDQQASGWLYNDLFADCQIHTTTVMLRAELLESVGLFDETLLRGQDYDYWFRVSRVTRIVKLDRVLSLYRIYTDSATYTPLPVNYGYQVLKQNLDRWGNVGPDGKRTPRRSINRRLANLTFGHGYAHFTRGRARYAVAGFWRSITYRPFRLRAWALLSLSAVKCLYRY